VRVADDLVHAHDDDRKVVGVDAENRNVVREALEGRSEATGNPK
jgi:hypothetical protein